MTKRDQNRLHSIALIVLIGLVGVSCTLCYYVGAANKIPNPALWAFLLLVAYGTQLLVERVLHGIETYFNTFRLARILIIVWSATPEFLHIFSHSDPASDQITITFIVQFLPLAAWAYLEYYIHLWLKVYLDTRPTNRIR